MFPLKLLAGVGLMLVLPVAMIGADTAGTPADDTIPVVIATSLGDITLELYPAVAPKTVSTFLGLADGTRESVNSTTGELQKIRFYDGLIFHRVKPDFIIQAGCPDGNGRGGPGFRFGDEINANSLGLDSTLVKEHSFLIQEVNNFLIQKLHIRTQAELQQRRTEFKEEFVSIGDLTVKQFYMRLGYDYQDTLPFSLPVKTGCLAMLNTGPNTNGSQFFIAAKDCPWLDGRHTVFGKVISGMEVVTKISQVEADASQKPLRPVFIKTISVRQ